MTDFIQIYKKSNTDLDLRKSNENIIVKSNVKNLTKPNQKSKAMLRKELKVPKTKIKNVIKLHIKISNGVNKRRECERKSSVKDTANVKDSINNINRNENIENIVKKSKESVDYIQELIIRYLKPKTPVKNGDIIINQAPNHVTAPAPPIILRQRPQRPKTPEPFLIREKPPKPIQKIEKKIISLPGKKMPPPSRKVIIEKIAELPKRSKQILIERWLPYSQQKRKVIYRKPIDSTNLIIEKPRNVIINWQSPDIEIKKHIRYLGVVRADPIEYTKRYKDSLINSDHLPQIVNEIPTPKDLTLAANKNTESEFNNFKNKFKEELEASKIINLKKEGLLEYRNYLKKKFLASKNYSKLSELNAGSKKSEYYFDKMNTQSSKTQSENDIILHTFMNDVNNIGSFKFYTQELNSENKNESSNLSHHTILQSFHIDDASLSTIKSDNKFNLIEKCSAQYVFN